MKDKWKSTRKLRNSVNISLWWFFRFESSKRCETKDRKSGWIINNELCTKNIVCVIINSLLIIHPLFLSFVSRLLELSKRKNHRSEILTEFLNCLICWFSFIFHYERKKYVWVENTSLERAKLVKLVSANYSQ